MAREIKKVETEKDSIYDSRPAKPVKRIAAWIVDMILMLVVATGIAWLVSLCYGYDNYNSIIEQKYVEYGLKYESSEEPGKYIYCDYPSDKDCQDKWEKCKNDPEFYKAYEMRVKGGPIILATSLSLTLLIFEGILPICLKHGRTIGMRFFGVGYVTEDGIEPPVSSILVRFIFGKLILGGLIPLFSLMYIINGSGFGLVGIIALILYFGVNGYLLVFTKEKRYIHDYIARMRPVDNDNQIYIKTTDELATLKAEEAMNRGPIK